MKAVIYLSCILVTMLLGALYLQEWSLAFIGYWVVTIIFILLLKREVKDGSKN